MESLEGVQKKFTGMWPGLECISYKETLVKLESFSLKRWKLKIMRGFDRLDSLSPKMGM